MCIRDRIDIHELKLVLNSLGENLSNKELKDMMDEADIDGNGGVDFDGMSCFVIGLCLTYPA